MDLEGLIEEITELVIRQLGGISSMSPVGLTKPVAHTVFVMGNGERGVEHLAVQARVLTKAGGRITFVPSASWPRDRIEGALPAGTRARVLESPPRAWSSLLEGCQALVVPNFSLHELAGLSSLLGVTTAADGIMAALVERIQVLAGADEAYMFLNLNAARLPKALLEAVRESVSRVGAFGVRLLEGQRIAQALASVGQPDQKPSVPTRVRNVLTREDVEILLAGGASTLEVTAGTIVTPLAQEVARQAGAEIVFL